MFHGHHIMNTTFAVLKPLAVAARHAVASLVLASLATSASAAMFTFEGSVNDGGPLAGQTISGNFAYDDLSAGFGGTIALSDFTLNFLGQTYTLASPNAAGFAWLSEGAFDGISYVVSDGSAVPEFSIDLVSGFPGEALQGQFGYLSNTLDTTVFGMFTITPSAVPEPHILGLLLAGGVAAACVARPRRQV